MRAARPELTIASSAEELLKGSFVKHVCCDAFYSTIEILQPFRSDASIDDIVKRAGLSSLACEVVERRLDIILAELLGSSAKDGNGNAFLCRGARPGADVLAGLGASGTLRVVMPQRESQQLGLPGKRVDSFLVGDFVGAKRAATATALARTEPVEVSIVVRKDQPRLFEDSAVLPVQLARREARDVAVPRVLWAAPGAAETQAAAEAFLDWTGALRCDDTALRYHAGKRNGGRNAAEEAVRALRVPDLEQRCGALRCATVERVAARGLFTGEHLRAAASAAASTLANGKDADDFIVIIADGDEASPFGIRSQARTSGAAEGCAFGALFVLHRAGAAGIAFGAELPQRPFKRPRYTPTL